LASKKYLPVFVATIAMLGVYVSLPLIKNALKSAKADAPMVSVLGTASVLNTGGSIYFAAAPYGSNVQVDNVTKQFTGYAWSADLGWIAFGSTDNPSGPVAMDSTTGILSGKARVLNTGEYIDFNALPQGSNVLAHEDGSFSGYAWSADFGWIDFSSMTAVGISLTSPEAPQTVRIYDVSDRNTADYAILVRWKQPTVFDPVAFESYLVERGTNGVDFAQVASTTSLAYYDTNVTTGTTYYYRIKTKYHTDTTSASDIVYIVPTGRYTSPPTLVSGPNATINPTSMTVTWATDRNCSSFVRIKDGNTYVSEQGQTEDVTSHTVRVVGLKPQQQYVYSIRSVDADGNVLNGEEKTITTENTPVIYDMNVSNITLNSAIVNFKSSAMANFTLYYGTSSNYGQTVSEQSGSTTTNHSIALSDLDAGTTYLFRVMGDDADGNEIKSENSFATLSLPKITHLTFESQPASITTTVKINWTTNVPTSSTVTYKFEGGVSQEKSTADLVTEHEMIVSDLADSAQYTFSIFGRDQFGNVTDIESRTFATPIDTRPPGISVITIETSNVGLGQKDTAQIAVSWKTDEPATSQVEYGEGISGTEYTRKTQEDPTLTNSHLVIISDLTPGKPYHLRVVSQDKARNSASSNDNTIISGEVSQSTLQIILKTLNNIFGWMGKLLQ